MDQLHTHVVELNPRAVELVASSIQPPAKLGTTQPTTYGDEGQARMELQKARTEFDRLAGVAFAQGTAVETAQKELAKEARYTAGVRSNKVKAEYDAVRDH